MTLKPILAASIAFLSLASLSRADISIPAQPVTVSPAVGTNPNNFFFEENSNGTYVNFTSHVPLAGHPGRTRELLDLFSVRMSDGLQGPNDFYPVVKARVAPLKRLAGYSVVKGTEADNVQTGRTNNAIYRTVFRVPGRGLYYTTGGVPGLLRIDTVMAPLTNAVIRHPEDTLADGFGIIFGGVAPHLGYQPLLSRGTARSTSVIPGASGSHPTEFAEYGGEVFFLADTPATSTTAAQQDLFETQYVANGSPSFYAVKRNVPGENREQLTGGNAGIYFTETSAGAAHSTLRGSLDGMTFATLFTSENLAVADANQLTPTINSSYSEIAFSSLDSAGRRRYTEYNTGNAKTIFPELTNVMSVVTTDPKDITSTGDYYYFNAVYNSSFRYICRHFTGGSTLDYLTESVTGNIITLPDLNDYEMALVPGGDLYFNADATINGVDYTDILFRIDPDSASPVAFPVTSGHGNYVTKARNLRGLSGNAIFRLYFSAPVNATDNSDYSSVFHGTIRDLGRKPWVVSH